MIFIEGINGTGKTELYKKLYDKYGWTILFFGSRDVPESREHAEQRISVEKFNMKFEDMISYRSDIVSEYVYGEFTWEPVVKMTEMVKTFQELKPFLILCKTDKEDVGDQWQKRMSERYFGQVCDKITAQFDHIYQKYLDIESLLKPNFIYDWRLDYLNESTEVFDALCLEIDKYLDGVER
jgi:hypothetical protein